MNEETKAALIVMLIFLSPLLIPIVKWFWLHPRVNAEKLKKRISEADELKRRLVQADELLIDLDLQTLKRLNIRAKGVRIIWSDNYSGGEKELNLLIDGNDKATDILKSLANEVKRDTTKKLLKVCYKLPKRHGKGDRATAITIHGIDK